MRECVCVCAKSLATLQPVQERGTNVAPGCRKLIYLSWAVPFPPISVSGSETSPVASDDDPLLLHKYTGKWHNLQPHAIQFTPSDVSSTTFYCDKFLKIIPVSRTVLKSTNRTEKAHLEKMRVTYLVKKFHTKSLRVLTVFTRACHRALSWTQTPCSTAHFTNLTVARLVKNPPPAPHFYELQRLITVFTRPTRGHYPQPNYFSLILAPYFLISILILPPHLYLGLQGWFSLHKKLVCLWCGIEPLAQPRAR